MPGPGLAGVIEVADERLSRALGSWESLIRSAGQPTTSMTNGSGMAVKPAQPGERRSGPGWASANDWAAPGEPISAPSGEGTHEAVLAVDGTVHLEAVDPGLGAAEAACRRAAEAVARAERDLAAEQETRMGWEARLAEAQAEQEARATTTASAEAALAALGTGQARERARDAFRVARAAAVSANAIAAAGERWVSEARRIAVDCGMAQAHVDGERAAAEVASAVLAWVASREGSARAAEEAASVALDTARAALASAEAVRLAEVDRIAEAARLAEEARLEEERRLAEEARLAEERHRAEEARLAEERRLADERRLAEERRRAEEARLAEQVRVAEEARLAAEAALAEAMRRVEAARAAAADATAAAQAMVAAPAPVLVLTAEGPAEAPIVAVYAAAPEADPPERAMPEPAAPEPAASSAEAAAPTPSTSPAPTGRSRTRAGRRPPAPGPVPAGPAESDRDANAEATPATAGGPAGPVAAHGGARIHAPASPHAPDGDGASPAQADIRTMRMPGDAAVRRILAGDLDALERVAGQLGDAPGDRARVAGRLTDLMETLLLHALDASAIAVPLDHPFWSLFTGEEAQHVVAALAILGHRFDGLGGWEDGRAPGQRELSLAVAHAGLDPMRIRRYPAGTDAEELLREAHVLGGDWLASVAPGLTVRELRLVLGRGADAFGDLWADWDRIRALLLAGT